MATPKGFTPTGIVAITVLVAVSMTETAGTDVVQAIHEAGPRLLNVHMKDLTNLGRADGECVEKFTSCNHSVLLISGLNVADGHSYLQLARDAPTDQ
jgi:sugar phosphate isomerase/epimerase